MNPSAATAAFILRKSTSQDEDSETRLLVARRGKEPAKGTFDLPGGFSDEGETGEECVRREVMEETGLQVTHAKYLFSLPNHYTYSGLDIPTLDQFFLCEVKPEENTHAMDDVAELFWIPLRKINPDDFGLDSIRRAVRRFLSFDCK